MYRFVPTGMTGIAGIRPELPEWPEYRNKIFSFKIYLFILYFLVLNILYLFVDLYRINNLTCLKHYINLVI